MDDPRPVLEFRKAELNPPDQPGNRIADVTLKVGRGQAIVVLTAVPADFHEEQFDYFPLADAASGLLACETGQVLFDGQDWSAMPPMVQARNRGRIGRLFDFHGWVYNLSVKENLMLAGRTHGRGESDLEGAAVAMAKRFGLGGVPDGRPVLLRKREQRLFEWIRALLPNPDLLILERPELDMPRLALDNCFGLVRESQDRGAAVVWITHEAEIARRAIGTGVVCYGVRGRTWYEKGEEG